MMKLPACPFTLVLALASTLALTACGGVDYARNRTEMPPAAPAPAPREQVKVAMLLPLTGKDAKLGEAMQNAATLAISDLGDKYFEVMFEDTASSASGATAATATAVQDQAKMILGPIFAEEARAARTASNGLPMIAYSTDSSVAAPGSYIMGVLPQDQARQIAQFAAARGARNTLIIAPNDAYGQLMVHSFSLTARQLGRGITGPIWIDPQNANLATQLNAALSTAAGRSVDSVFLPLPVDRSTTIVTTLQRSFTGKQPLIMGTGLWDDADMTLAPALAGAYYAGPSTATRTRFEQTYERQFGAKPPRLASLAYDSVALAITIGRNAGANGYNAQTLTSPNGYAGINGLFRFRPDGLVERSLAIIQIQPTGRTVIVPAAQSFTPVNP